MLWRQFENYATQFGAYAPSHWHSEILHFAERCMKEREEFRFFSFFKKWNPERLRTDDWKDQKRGESTFSSLAQKAIKKACALTLKQSVRTESLAWLITVSEEAVRRLPDDDYLARDLAQLYKQNGQIEQCNAYYRKLALSLADKYYVWKEFSQLIDENDIEIKAGMLAKALTVERNEDFLGEVRLLMAKYLIKLCRLGEAQWELNTYRTHRSKQGWKYDERLNQLQEQIKASGSVQAQHPNYHSLIRAADRYAYRDIPWHKMTVLDRWTNKDGKVKVKLYLDKVTGAAVNPKRFSALRKAVTGEVVDVKLLKRPSKDGLRDVVSPLIVKSSSDDPWSALPLTVGVVDFVNKDKGGVGIVTLDGKFIYMSTNDLPRSIRKGEFVSGRLIEEVKIKKEKELTPRILTRNAQPKTVERASLFNLKVIPPEDALPLFPERTILVDHVNVRKQLFHFIAEENMEGIAFFRDTTLRPHPGEHYKARCYTKLDNKTGIKRIHTFNFIPTNDVLSSRMKQLKGTVNVVYRDDNMFGFVLDTYVPGNLLEKAGIFDDTIVLATVVFANSKWRVIDIKVVNTI